jgi:CYTH domain-containing protein
MKATNYYDSDKFIAFCDRGILDGAAYVSQEEFEKLLAVRNLSLSDIYNRYDAVLHMVTAADGAEQFYLWNDPTKEGVGNNAARSESPEEARVKDKKTLNAWIGHPHLRVFDNSTDFDGKVKRVIDEVFALLGEPVPTEIERKFLIKRPTQEELNKLGALSVTNIIQTYLTNSGNIERRVRQRGTKENGYSFYYTEKTEIGHGQRIEREDKISASDYIAYLAEADTVLHQISKTRYCFIYNQRYFELDIYPFSDQYAILEIELRDINEDVNMPPLTILKEVTGDNCYKNYELAKTLTLDPNT